MLLQPVAQRANGAAGPTARVGEEGGVQEGEDDVENGGRDEPDTAVPPQPHSNADAQNGHSKQSRAHNARLQEDAPTFPIKQFGPKSGECAHCLYLPESIRHFLYAQYHEER